MKNIQSRMVVDMTEIFQDRECSILKSKPAISVIEVVGWDFLKIF